MPPAEQLVLFRRTPAKLRRAWLTRFAKVLRDRVAGGRQLLFLITDDRELRRLNLQFLGKDYATDVLSFPQTNPESLLGEVAISVQRAALQARQFGHTVEQELKILMLHGVLHLLGMDHEADHGQMASAEIIWRSELGLPAGLIERVQE